MNIINKFAATELRANQAMIPLLVSIMV